MWQGNTSNSYAPTTLFGSLCNTISSCLGLLCRCCLFQDCLGGRQRPTPPLLSPPPPGLMDSRLGDLGGPHSPFGPPSQHGSLIHHGPPPPYGLMGPPTPPRVPNAQPGPPPY